MFKTGFGIIVNKTMLVLFVKSKKKKNKKQRRKERKKTQILCLSHSIVNLSKEN